jgi:hypothetical protein
LLDVRRTVLIRKRRLTSLFLYSRRSLFLFFSFFTLYYIPPPFNLPSFIPPFAALRYQTIYSVIITQYKSIIERGVRRRKTDELFYPRPTDIQEQTTQCWMFACVMVSILPTSFSPSYSQPSLFHLLVEKCALRRLSVFLGVCQSGLAGILSTTNKQETFS